MKNIIFDIGSIIVKTDYNKILDDFTNNEEEKNFLINEVIKSPLYGLIDTGYITIEELINIINDKTNNVYKDLVNKFFHEYVKYKSYNEYAFDIIDKLKNNGYKIYILSNLSEYVYKNFSEKIESIADGVVISYKVHMVKPNEGIYKYLLDKYNLNPEETLFMDDRESNIRTANKLGIKGRKVIPNSEEDLKLVLKEYNINI